VVQVIFNALFALTALVAILDYFGVKPSEPSWGLKMPLNRNWKLGIMLGLVAVSFALSSYGLYRSLRPRIVEKIVEKPVDKIVEKECPKCEGINRGQISNPLIASKGAKFGQQQIGEHNVQTGLLLKALVALLKLGEVATKQRLALSTRPLLRQRLADFRMGSQSARAKYESKPGMRAMTQ
jgi:hypothetical protein